MISDKASEAGPSAAARLTGGFPPGDLALWRAQVEKLTGGPPERLARLTHDRIEVRPLYGPEPEAGEPCPWPGVPPFTRGAVAPAAQGPCEIRERVGHPDPAEAALRLGEALAGGAERVAVLVDRAAARGAAAPDGVLLADLGDLERLLAGRDLRATPLLLDAGWRSPEILALAVAAGRRRGLEPSALDLEMAADPFGAAIAETPVDLDHGLERSVELACWWAEAGLRATALRADGASWHAAGASAAQELAVVLAAALHYLRALEAKGQAPERAARLVAFRLALDADVTTGIVKLRCLRRLWSRVMEACGGSAEGMTVHAVTATRMLARRDVEVNLLRLAAATFAALVGGARSITVLPHDPVPETGGPVLEPSPDARRLARNIALIQRHESGLERVIDPAGGSFALESQTEALAREAWSLFQAIEGGQGLPAMLVRGSVQDWVQETWGKRRQDVARRAQPITGVSSFPNFDELPDPPNAVAVAVAGLIAAAAERLAVAEETRGVGLDRMIEAAAAGKALLATLPPGSVSPLLPQRFAHAFELLRERGDAWVRERGRRPAALLVQAGPTREAARRAALARQLMASGGIGARVLTLAADRAAGPALTAEERPVLAVICGLEPDAPELEALAGSLRAAGAARVWLAHDGADAAAACVDGVLAPGCDAVAVLEEAWSALGDLP